jgi:hypothetical protein
MPVFPRFGVSLSHKAAEHLAKVQTCVFGSLTIEFIHLIWYPPTTTAAGAAGPFEGFHLAV